jgi:ribonuclease P protein component
MESAKESFTLHKQERLCSRKAMEELFAGNSRSVLAYPIRAVYQATEETGIRMMVSVSKRYFKRAVKRNRIKRQLREAYRLNKHLLCPVAGGLNIAFLWTCNELLPTKTVITRMQNLINKINESVTATEIVV